MSTFSPVSKNKIQSPSQTYQNGVNCPHLSATKHHQTKKVSSPNIPFPGKNYGKKTHPKKGSLQFSPVDSKSVRKAQNIAFTCFQTDEAKYLDETYTSTSFLVQEPIYTFPISSESSQRLESILQQPFFMTPKDANQKLSPPSFPSFTLFIDRLTYRINSRFQNSIFCHDAHVYSLQPIAFHPTGTLAKHVLYPDLYPHYSDLDVISQLNLVICSENFYSQEELTNLKHHVASLVYEDFISLIKEHLNEVMQLTEPDVLDLAESLLHKKMKIIDSQSFVLLYMLGEQDTNKKLDLSFVVNLSFQNRSTGCFYATLLGESASAAFISDDLKIHNNQAISWHVPIQIVMFHVENRLLEPLEIKPETFFRYCYRFTLGEKNRNLALSFTHFRLFASSSFSDIACISAKFSLLEAKHPLLPLLSLLNLQTYYLHELLEPATNVSSYHYLFFNQHIFSCIKNFPKVSPPNLPTSASRLFLMIRAFKENSLAHQEKSSLKDSFQTSFQDTQIDINGHLFQLILPPNILIDCLAFFRSLNSSLKTNSFHEIIRPIFDFLEESGLYIFKNKEKESLNSPRALYDFFELFFLNNLAHQDPKIIQLDLINLRLQLQPLLNLELSLPPVCLSSTSNTLPPYWGLPYISISQRNKLCSEFSHELMHMLEIQAKNPKKDRASLISFIQKLATEKGRDWGFLDLNLLLLANFASDHAFYEKAFFLFQKAFNHFISYPQKFSQALASHCLFVLKYIDPSQDLFLQAINITAQLDVFCPSKLFKEGFCHNLLLFLKLHNIDLNGQKSLILDQPELAPLLAYESLLLNLLKKNNPHTQDILNKLAKCLESIPSQKTTETLGDTLIDSVQCFHKKSISTDAFKASLELYEKNHKSIFHTSPEKHFLFCLEVLGINEPLISDVQAKILQEVSVDFFHLIDSSSIKHASLSTEAQDTLSQSLLDKTQATPADPLSQKKLQVWLEIYEKAHEAIFRHFPKRRTEFVLNTLELKNTVSDSLYEKTLNDAQQDHTANVYQLLTLEEPKVCAYFKSFSQAYLLTLIAEASNLSLASSTRSKCLSFLSFFLPHYLELSPKEEQKQELCMALGALLQSTTSFAFSQSEYENICSLLIAFERETQPFSSFPTPDSLHDLLRHPPFFNAACSAISKVNQEPLTPLVENLNFAIFYIASKQSLFSKAVEHLEMNMNSLNHHKTLRFIQLIQKQSLIKTYLKEADEKALIGLAAIWQKTLLLTPQASCVEISQAYKELKQSISLLKSIWHQTLQIASPKDRLLLAPFTIQILEGRIDIVSLTDHCLWRIYEIELLKFELMTFDQSPIDNEAIGELFDQFKKLMKVLSKKTSWENRGVSGFLSRTYAIFANSKVNLSILIFALEQLTVIHTFSPVICANLRPQALSILEKIIKKFQLYDTSQLLCPIDDYSCLTSAILPASFLGKHIIFVQSLNKKSSQELSELVSKSFALFQDQDPQKWSDLWLPILSKLGDYISLEDRFDFLMKQASICEKSDSLLPIQLVMQYLREELSKRSFLAPPQANQLCCFFLNSCTNFSRHLDQGEVPSLNQVPCSKPKETYYAGKLITDLALITYSPLFCKAFHDTLETSPDLFYDESHMLSFMCHLFGILELPIRPERKPLLIQELISAFCLKLTSDPHDIIISSSLNQLLCYLHLSASIKVYTNPELDIRKVQGLIDNLKRFYNSYSSPGSILVDPQTLLAKLLNNGVAGKEALHFVFVSPISLITSTFSATIDAPYASLRVPLATESNQKKLAFSCSLVRESINFYREPCFLEKLRLCHTYGPLAQHELVRLSYRFLNPTLKQLGLLAVRNLLSESLAITEACSVITAWAGSSVLYYFGGFLSFIEGYLIDPSRRISLEMATCFLEKTVDALITKNDLVMEDVSGIEEDKDLEMSMKIMALYFYLFEGCFYNKSKTLESSFFTKDSPLQLPFTLSLFNKLTKQLLPPLIEKAISGDENSCVFLVGTLVKFCRDLQTENSQAFETTKNDTLKKKLGEKIISIMEPFAEHMKANPLP